MRLIIRLSPLSIYLITFIIAFDKDGWYLRSLWMSLLFVSLVLLTRLMILEFTNESVSPLYQIAVYCFALFTCCMVCHGELARRRSSVPHLTTFYLYVALGGAIGGVLVSSYEDVVNSCKLRSIQSAWYDPQPKVLRWTDDFSNLLELVDWND